MDRNNGGYPFEGFVKINHLSEKMAKQNHSLPIFK